MRYRSAGFVPRVFSTVLTVTLLSAPMKGAEDPVPWKGVRAKSVQSPGMRTPSSRTELPGLPGVMERLRSARSAAKASAQASPLASLDPTSNPAPLVARIGSDVTLIPRPGVGTPMQIRGGILKAKVGLSAPGEDADLTTARAFLQENRSLLALENPREELRLSRGFLDELGMRHLRFDQRWRGLEVWPADLIVHLDRAGHVYLMDGAFVPSPRGVLVRPIVDAAAAARRARSGVSGADRASVSEPRLFVYAPGTRSPRLAWSVDVDVSVSEQWRVVIDAANGAKLATISRILTENVVGSGRDLSGVTRTLNVWNQGGTFSLVDTSKPMFDPTSAPPDLDTTRGAIFILDAANTPASSDPDPGQATIRIVTSSNPNSWTPPDAVSAGFFFSRTFDYYRNMHGRNSLDGNGGNIIAVVRLGQNFQNAFWNGKAMFFGDARPYANALDIVAHELTHGVTENSANLIYQDQPGALNEAWSDIFGQAVEAVLENGADWLHGDATGAADRNMRDPGALEIIPGSGRPYPSKMSQFLTATDPFLQQFTNSDSGGVHINSSIINHCFYLLAEGLPGAIGRADAERIFYRALIAHLSKNSQFLDARLACIQSATELFGAASAQATKTAEAFDEVEILTATPAPPPPEIPPVASADSTLFVYRDGPIRLGRRETALGDPAQGVGLGTTAAAAARPSVSGDGTLAFFVTSTNDACFIATTGAGSPACLGFAGQIASVTMSRDESFYAFVLLDSAGQRDNRITIVDLPSNLATTYTLVAPTTDGGFPSEALFADALDFTASKRFLLYDVFNVLNLLDGTQIGLWSISAIDLTSDQTYSVIPPFPGLDIGFPTVARTSDDYFVFEADAQTTGEAAIYTARLSTGDVVRVITGIPSGPAGPVYAGDDRALVYSYPDATATGRSLARVSLAADRLTATGAPTPFLSDGVFPTIYRRGNYRPPSGNCTASATTLCLSGGRFQVGVTFTTSQGQQGQAQAVSLTSDTGYFSFFDPSNVEIVVKVLDACALNQRGWVFAGGLTNVATVITVTDTFDRSDPDLREPPGPALPADSGHDRLRDLLHRELPASHRSAAGCGARPAHGSRNCQNSGRNRWRPGLRHPGRNCRARRFLSRRPGKWRLGRLHRGRPDPLSLRRQVSGPNLLADFDRPDRQRKRRSLDERHRLLLVLRSCQRRDGREGLERLRLQSALLGVRRRPDQRPGDDDGDGHANRSGQDLHQPAGHRVSADPGHGGFRDLSLNVASLAGPACAPARDSAGCGLDRAPGPSLRFASRGARLLPGETTRAANRGLERCRESLASGFERLWEKAFRELREIRFQPRREG